MRHNKPIMYFKNIYKTPMQVEKPEWNRTKVKKTTSLNVISLRSADAFPVVASLPPKNSVCEPERQNDFRDVKPF